MQTQDHIGKRRLKRLHYASIIESFLAMFVLLLIFFGILQLYKLTLAHMVSEYAAFRGARSSSVGFDDTLVARETRIKTIPVSGNMVEPVRSEDIGDSRSQFYYENRAIERYSEGTRYMDYEYWHGQQNRHNNYKCPYYGTAINSGYCSICNANGTRAATLSIDQSANSDTAKVSLVFDNYPMTMPLFEVFSKKGCVTIEAEAKLTNHAYTYLEE